MVSNTQFLGVALLLICIGAVPPDLSLPTGTYVNDTVGLSALSLSLGSHITGVYLNLGTGKFAIRGKYSAYNQFLLLGVPSLRDVIALHASNQSRMGTNFGTNILYGENVTMDYAKVRMSTITPVDTIMRCPTYNRTSARCTERWRNPSIRFTQYEGYIEFNLNSFSSYGGIARNEKQFVTSTSNTPTPSLDLTQDATVNSNGVAMSGSTLYTMMNASGSATSFGLMRTTDNISFKNYWTTGDRVNQAYVTHKLYVDSALVCQSGDDSTGGSLLNTGTTTTITANCIPAANQNITNTSTINYVLNVWAQNIGGGGAARRTATISWDTATDDTWVQIEFIAQVDINATIPNTFQTHNATVEGYLFWTNGTLLSNKNITVEFRNTTNNVVQKRNVTTNGSGYYTDYYTLPADSDLGSWSINATGYFNESIYADTLTNFTVANPGPVVNELIVTPFYAANGSIVTVSANVTDNTAVSTVIAEILYPNASAWQNVTLTGSNPYVNTFLSPESPMGNYTVRIWANDTLSAITNTTTTQFIPYINLSQNNTIIVDGIASEWTNIIVDKSETENYTFDFTNVPDTLIGLEGLAYAPDYNQTLSATHGMVKVFNFTNNTFSLISDGPKDDVFYGHGLTYDPKTQTLWSYGGIYPSNSTRTNMVTGYNFSSQTWVDRIAPWTPRAFTQTVYHPNRQLTYIFGGEVGVGTHTNETWSYNASSDTWTNLTTTNTLPNNIYASSYDSTLENIIVARRNRSWIFYAENDTFQKIPVSNATQFISKIWFEDSLGLTMFYDTNGYIGLLSKDLTGWEVYSAPTSPAFGFATTNIIHNAFNSKTLVYRYNSDFVRYLNISGKLIPNEVNIKNISVSNNETSMHFLLQTIGNISDSERYRIYLGLNATGSTYSPENFIIPIAYNYFIEYNGSCNLYDESGTNISFCAIDRLENTLEISINSNALGLVADDNVNVSFETIYNNKQADLAPDSGSFINYKLLIPISYPQILFNESNPAYSYVDIDVVTNENTNISIEYGLSTSLGTIGNQSNVNQTNHSLRISGLNQNTTYFYNVTVCNEQGLCTTQGPYNFTTWLAGWLNVTLLSDAVLSGNTGDIVEAQARLECIGGINARCELLQTDLQYNGSSSTPDTSLSTVVGTPLYVVDHRKELTISSANYATRELVVDAERNIYTLFRFNAGSSYNIIKYNQTGGEQWTTNAAGSSSSYEGNSISVGSNNQIFSGGNTTSNRALLHLVNNTGDVQWYAEVNKASNIRFFDVVANASGQSYAIANTYFASYNSSGIQDWNTTIPSVGFATTRGITLDEEGNILLIADLYLMKFNSSGDQIWNLSIDQFTPQELDVNTQGTVFVTGGNTSHQFISTYTSEGEEMYAIANNYSTKGTGIRVDDLGLIHTVGETISGTYYFAMHDENGVLLWNETSTLGNVSTGVDVHSSQRVYFLGYESVGFNRPYDIISYRYSLNPYYKTLTGGEGINMSWEINLTGNPGTSYLAVVNSSSTTYSDVPSNTTEQFLINILSVDMIISDVAAINITPHSATIVWNTSLFGNSSIEYGVTNSLGSVGPSTSNYNTTHRLTITDLLPEQTYYYNVTSCTSTETCNTSGPYNFTTDFWDCGDQIDRSMYLTRNISGAGTCFTIISSDLKLNGNQFAISATTAIKTRGDLNNVTIQNVNITQGLIEAQNITSLTIENSMLSNIGDGMDIENTTGLAIINTSIDVVNIALRIITSRGIIESSLLDAVVGITSIHSALNITSSELLVATAIQGNQNTNISVLNTTSTANTFFSSSANSTHALTIDIANITGALSLASNTSITLELLTADGKITFINPVTSTVPSMENITIANNYAFINSTQTPALNLSANITLYNIPEYIEPAIYRDGSECPSNICTALTPLTAGTVVFNVTHWSGYGIGETVSITECNWEYVVQGPKWVDGLIQDGDVVTLDCFVQQGIGEQEDVHITAAWNDVETSTQVHTPRLLFEREVLS